MSTMVAKYLSIAVGFFGFGFLLGYFFRKLLGLDQPLPKIELEPLPEETQRFIDDQRKRENWPEQL